MISFDTVLERIIPGIVGKNLDWFFKKTLHEHYGARRQILKEGNHDFELMPAIDYIIKTCVDETAQYPPESTEQWHEWFLKLGSGYSHVFQQLLILYLQLDITNYLSVRERESKAGRQTRGKDKAELSILDAALAKLISIPRAFDFTRPLNRVSTGLWAMDNDQLGLMINCLSDPCIQLSSYFESPKELVRLIVGTLEQCGNPRMALFMSRAHRYEHWDEEYDQMYSYLLLSSGQLVEALKYERMFADKSNYTSEVLQHFFELCSKLDVIKSLNCLNLSVEEEEALNQHIVIESSRPVTPSSQVSHQTRRVTISESNTPAATRHKSNLSSSHTPRNRSVQQLKKMPSFSDSPARNTRSARKKKVPK